jgi:hypothetical protein
MVSSKSRSSHYQSARHAFWNQILVEPITHAGHGKPVVPRSFVITPGHSLREVWREEPFASLPMSHIDATVSKTTLILDLLGTAEQTCPPRGDETGLLTLDGIAGDGGRFSDMLVVTTSVGMVDGVHGNTTSPGPAVALGGELGISAFVERTIIAVHTLCLARDAFMRGLSVRPPPATMPTIPRHELGRTFLAPDGSLTRVLPSSGLWPMTVT